MIRRLVFAVSMIAAAAPAATAAAHSHEPDGPQAEAAKVGLRLGLLDWAVPAPAQPAAPADPAPADQAAAPPAPTTERAKAK